MKDRGLGGLELASAVNVGVNGVFIGVAGADSGVKAQEL